MQLLPSCRAPVVSTPATSLCLPRCRAVRAVASQRCYADAAGTIANSKRLPYGGSGSFVEDMAEFCAPSFVQWSNDAVPGSTEIRVQVLDYPGVLRVICWVLNGLDVRVESAKLRVDDDNMLDDTFIVKGRSGKQLTKARAQEVAERVEDFVMYCSKVGSRDVQDWTLGPVHISNKTNEQYTEITVLETGVRQDTGAGISTGRVFKFQVTESSGEKLTEQSVNSVLYTLSMVLGQGFAPTTIPTGLGYVAQSVVNAEA